VPHSSGQLKSKTSGTDTTTYTYDELGNLVRVVLPRPNMDRIDYLIDGRNRRVGRTVNGHWLKAWLYGDQLSPVAELDSTGAVSARYVYGGRANAPDYMAKSGTTYRLVTDQLGSVRLVVNDSTGAVAERIDYDAWGRVISDTNPGFLTLGFASGIYDQDTKLVRFAARDYDAGVGRWLSKDPLGPAGGNPNVYLYVDSDPVNLTDRRGLVGDPTEGNEPLHRPGDPPRYHGNWGGPCYGNGKTQDETGHYPYLPSHRGFVAPEDARDECYREHDVNLMKCARLGDDAARQSCRREADLDLSYCLITLGDRGGVNLDPRVILEFYIFNRHGSPNNNTDRQVP
jgi:RHS repeat-associated protein